MKIIQVHNYYKLAGGEDAVVESERVMLQKNGHDVVEFYKSNDAISNIPTTWMERMTSFFAFFGLLLNTIWNFKIYAEFRALLQKEQPDVVHCHNTFPLISPSIYWACAKEKVPVVQTLHNYRLLCLNAFLFRTNPSEASNPDQSSCSSGGGSICEKCLRKPLKYPGVYHRCYRGSIEASATVALMHFVHHCLGTWTNKVSAYITLSEFQKRKMVEGGLPEQKIWVKPNFLELETLKTGEIHTNGDADSSDFGANYALFVGRLSPEKGCDLLIRAWSHALQQEFCSTEQSANRPTDQQSQGTSDALPQLLIVGDGPEQESLERLAETSGAAQSIRFFGRKGKSEVLSLMHDARFLVFPSIWYETFGLTVLEAGLQGTPSIISAPTTTSGLIEHQQTGLVFTLADEHSLVSEMIWAFENPNLMKIIGNAARQEFQTQYSAQENHKQLLEIYLQLITRST